jgi:Ca2+:H+ antiporter
LLARGLYVLDSVAASWQNSAEWCWQVGIAGGGSTVVKGKRDYLKWSYLLLIAVPGALIAWLLDGQGSYAGQLTGVIFGLALVAVIPLAMLIGRTIKTLEEYLGDRLAGLLGASFSNAPELAIGISLLVHAHMNALQPEIVSSDLRVIRGLLIGSVINNALFVLGSSIFFGAIHNGRMRFKAESAGGYASMLALAVVGLALPTIATSLASVEPSALAQAQVNVSIPFGVILIVSYIAYIAATEFNIGTRPRKGAVAEGAAREGASVEAEGAVALAEDPSEETELQAEVVREEEAEERDRERERTIRREKRRQNPYAVPVALIQLGAATVATVIIAVVLVSVTDSVIANSVLTPLSVGLILFPIVCNLGEQAGAIMNAWQNRMEVTMAIAAGSGVQVALFVTPVLALASVPLAAGLLQLTLPIIFPPLELIVLGLVVFVYALVSLDGETTWLEGLQLLAFYCMVAAVSFVLPGR